MTILPVSTTSSAWSRVEFSFGSPVYILRYCDEKIALNFPCHLHPSDQKYLSTLKNTAARAQMIASRHVLNAQYSWYPKRLNSGVLQSDCGRVGSLSHKAGLVAGVVEPRGSAMSVGLDLEILNDRMESIWARILSSSDESVVGDSVQKLGRARVCTVMFAAKEALFKAHFPLTGKRFHFHDVATHSLSSHYVTFKVKKDREEVFATKSSSRVYYNWVRSGELECVVTKCLIGA